MNVASTPEFVAETYRKMERNLEIVRSRLNRPLTLAEKLLLGHLDDPETAELERGQSYVQLRPDRVVLQDVLGQTAMLAFVQTGRTRVAVPTTVHCDHLIQAREEGQSDLKESLTENEEVEDFLGSISAKLGLRFGGSGAGRVHQCVLET